MLDYEIESGEDRARRGMRMKSGVYWHEYMYTATLAIFALTSIPEFYEIVDILAFIRVIRKSRSARYCQSIQWHVYVRGSRWKRVFFSLFFFLNCPTIGISSARTNNYLIACLNYAFCHEDRYRGNWTWKLFGKKGKRGVNLERIKFTRARKKEGDEKIK